MFESSEADRLLLDARFVHASGRSADARTLLERVLAIDPANPMALSMLADIALERRDHAAAMSLTDQALATEPNFAPAWYQRARALWFAGRQVESFLTTRQAAAIQPANPQFRIHLAQLAAWMGYHAEAYAALAPLLAPYLKPGGLPPRKSRLADPRLLIEKPSAPDQGAFAQAVSALAELALNLGRFEEADALLRRGLELYPVMLATQMMLGMNQLRLGQYADGWENYAARESIRHIFPDGPPNLPGRTWRGEDLAGSTILIFDDQGHGDAIQFFRLLPLLRERGAARVCLLTFPGLERLFQQAAPWVGVFASLPAGMPIDWHCSSSALPRWLGATPDSVPAGAPYLAAPRGHALRLPPGRGPKVGLAWSGDPGHMRDHLRSIPAAAFLRLTTIPGVRFHSLQRDVRPRDQAALRRGGIDRTVEQAADFADTAALVAQMDLVVTVDTSVAHLAAAMGKPVWIVVHVAADWRWMADREDSPWYPSVRLFRVRPDEWGQGDPGWVPVLDRVAAALRERFAAAAAPRGATRRGKASTARG